MKTPQLINRRSPMNKAKHIVRRGTVLSLLFVLAFLALLFSREQNAAPAAVIITEFSDFQCPYCKRAATVVEQVRKSYGARVKVVFKQMPLPMHLHAFKAAQASVCAREQGKFWEYHDRLFAAGDLSVDELNRMASTVGLNPTDFSQCLSSEKSKIEVEQDVAEAERLGVSGTPTFFVNGKVVRGASTFAALKQEIDGTMTKRNHPLLPSSSAGDSLFVENTTSPLSTRPQGSASKNSAARISSATGANLILKDQPASSTTTASGVTLSPASINLGYQLVGTTGPQVTERVTNSGTAPLIITDISVSGRDRRDFTSAYSFTLPATVAPGGSVDINLTFIPALPWRPGTRNARLVISEERDSHRSAARDSRLETDEDNDEEKDSQHVPLTGIGAKCSGPLPGCSSGCADTDGDGLNNAWEIAGGIDLNNDGEIDARHDLLLQVAKPNKPDIFVWYDWMDYGLDGDTCATDSNCRALGRAHLGETCQQQGALEGQCAYVCSTDSDCTSRWPTDVHAGERCVSNVCEHTHDPLVLNAHAFRPVIAQFAAHGIKLHILRGNAQPHSHVVSFRNDAQMDLNCEGASVAAGTAGLGKYAESFYNLKARSNPDQLNLAYHYLVFAHLSGCDSRAHCPATPGNSSDCPNTTMTFGQAGMAELSGNDLIVSMGGQVNNIGVSPRFETPVTFMHELGHNLGLHHDGHLDQPCTSGAGCPTGETCTDLADGQGRVCHEATGGVIGAEEPNYKPNYISIMNYRYEQNFIRIAAGVGSRVPLGCASNSDCGGNGAFCDLRDASSHCSISGRVCGTNSDCTVPGDSCVPPPIPSNTCSTTGYVCVTDSDCTGGDACLPPSPGYCARLDYSSQTLPTGGATPGALDENNLNDLVGLGSGTSDLFNYTDALCHVCPLTAPTSGPVDWAGNGIYTTPDCSLHLIGVESFTDTGVQADIDTPNGICSSAPQDVLHGHTDWPDLSGILFNYKFQCRPNGAN